MFIIKIADIKIKINNIYNSLSVLCKDYIIDSNEFDFEVTVTKPEIEKVMKETEHKFSEGYAESICCYRKICSLIPLYDAILLHGAAISVDNEGYIFMAKSGVGKTTHTKLWQQLLGDKMIYINGDKPIVRLINNKVMIYGTPWCGKENYGNNICVPLKALCFIERSQTNEITKIDGTDLLKKIAYQIFIPKSNVEIITKSIDVLSKVLEYNCYLLKCNMDIGAAKLSYEQMKK